mgnify:CR=1 FL=1
MIPPKQIQEIMDVVRIEEVVGDFVALRRRGVNLIGLCPFHQEKTPSFNVNPARNIFKCFGCGKSGDAVTFLIEHERFTYPDALRWLARRYNIRIEETERSPEQIAEQQRADSLYILNEFALRHFVRQMNETDEGRSVALEYFRSRGLTPEIIEAFGLGYAPETRDLLIREARQAGYSVELLKTLGLCSPGGTRDFFRARVMFPIHNLSGKVAAFAGRTLSAEKNIPKYVNSPETEIYVKNKILYGAFQARRSMRQLNECILVEGYMDVISLHQHGIDNAVASSGTSLTEGQVQLIRRNAENLLILYDADAAGIAAALRGVDMAVAHLDVRIALLPPGEDPDSFVQKMGAEAFRDYLRKHAKDFVRFKIECIVAEAQNDPLKKAKAIDGIAATLAIVKDAFKRNLLFQECIPLIHIGDTGNRMETERQLIERINRLISADLKKQADRQLRQPGHANDPSPAPESPYPEPFAQDPALSPTSLSRAPAPESDLSERDLIRLLILYGDKSLSEEGVTLARYLLTDIEDTLDNFDNPLYGRIARLCGDRLLNGEAISASFFFHHPDPEIRDLAIDLANPPYQMSENWEKMWQLPLQNQPMPDENYIADLRWSLAWFKLRKLNHMCQISVERIKNAAAVGDFDLEIRYLRTHQKLKQAHNQLAKELGATVL